MIYGRVVNGMDLTIQISVIGSAGQKSEFDAVIDTGFSGALTLPKDLAAALSLVRSGGCTAILADGSVVESRVYHAVVQIDDVQTEVRAVEVPDAPLIGMELLKGFRVQFDVKPDGEVIVYRLP